MKKIIFFLLINLCLIADAFSQSNKYDHTNENSNQPDLRSTIYWNPEIKTGKDGNASFDYYNADGTSTYKVTVEGIDDNGNVGRVVYRYKVE